MTPSMTIGGKSAAAVRTFPVVDPTIGVPVAEAPDCSPDQLDEAFAAAASAFPDWRRDEDSRRNLLRQLGEAILAARDDLVRLLVAESGKSPALVDIELRACQVWLDHLADIEIPRTVLRDDATALAEVTHRPLGVVAAIAPWNFPLSSAILKIAPALRTGNTVVLKPSPFTPLATLRLGEVLGEVLPAGVVNVVSGGDPLGAAMTRHPTPRKITFTGSIPTGKHVAVSAAADLKRVTLELGGNDAAILLDDIDIASVVPQVLGRAFFNVGQACALPKRIFVPDNIYDEVADAFAAAAGALTAAPGGSMGPLSTRPQYERVGELVSAAIRDGAKPVAGGGPMAGPGFFFAPTILARAEEGQRIVDEEQFGPALPLLRYSTVEDAVRRANHTMFGLCGSVWGTDADRAAEVAEQLECGSTFVNCHSVHSPSMPFLGVKWSGIGVENGMEGLLAFTDPQVVYRARSADREIVREGRS